MHPKLTLCYLFMVLLTKQYQEVTEQRHIKLLGEERMSINGCRTFFPHLMDISLCRKENNQSNNFDDSNHDDSEMVEIITMCCVLGSASNSISEQKKILTNPSK